MDGHNSNMYLAIIEITIEENVVLLCLSVSSEFAHSIFAPSHTVPYFFLVRPFSISPYSQIGPSSFCPFHIPLLPILPFPLNFPTLNSKSASFNQFTVDIYLFWSLEKV